MSKLRLDAFSDIFTDSDTFESELKNGPSKTIKWGADPSAPDLHLGHCVILNQLAKLQNFGHHVQFVIGDFTAQIGDPTGKSETRKPLSKADVKTNAETYLNQVFKVLDKSKTTVYYNSSWLNALTSIEIIGLCAKQTVARMLERDDFSKRFSQHSPIGIHEFLYPLFQGYDSVHLKSDVEIGGTDQTFNLLIGRQLQKDAGISPQSVLTVPILEGLDGTQKMSKSLNNHIGILDEPNDMFGKCMSIPDALIERYFLLGTNAPDTLIHSIQKRLQSDENPRNIKLDLAKTIVTQFHCSTLAESAEKHFIQVFSKQEIPSNIPEKIGQKGQSFTLVSLLVDYELAPSKKEARRLIQQGAVSINSEKITNPSQLITLTEDFTIKVGKRMFLKLVCQS